MKWDELTDKQAKEYVEYLNGYKDSLEQLNADKQMILDTAKCKEADLPPQMRDMLDRNQESWKQSWGMYGSKFKDMRYTQQKEVNDYFKQQGIVNDIRKDTEKTKDKSNGR
jgi:hypothetical protein